MLKVNSQRGSVKRWVLWKTNHEEPSLINGANTLRIVSQESFLPLLSCESSIEEAIFEKGALTRIWVWVCFHLD